MSYVNQVEFNPATRTLVVNGEDWGNLGLDAWVLEAIAAKARLHKGLEFVVCDAPINEPARWQEYGQSVMLLDIDIDAAVKKVLHLKSYRGHFQKTQNVLDVSRDMGTDVPYSNHPITAGENALVFWYHDPHKWALLYLR